MACYLFATHRKLNMKLLLYLYLEIWQNELEKAGGVSVRCAYMRSLVYNLYRQVCNWWCIWERTFGPSSWIYLQDPTLPPGYFSSPSSSHQSLCLFSPLSLLHLLPRPSSLLPCLPCIFSLRLLKPQSPQLSSSFRVWISFPWHPLCWPGYLDELFSFTSGGKRGRLCHPFSQTHRSVHRMGAGRVVSFTRGSKFSFPLLWRNQI